MLFQPKEKGEACCQHSFSQGIYIPIPLQYNHISNTVMLKQNYFLLPVNHALFSYASQSNTSRGGYANHAVDGNKSGMYKDFSCTLTPTEDNPFWSVSFEPDSVNITAVRITNRQDCCQDRLSNFEIRIGDYFGEEAVRNPKCGGLHTISGSSKVISCPNMIGRILTIRIPGKHKSLSLCEVEVFGTRKYSLYVFNRVSKNHCFICYTVKTA